MTKVDGDAARGLSQQQLAEGVQRVVGEAAGADAAGAVEIQAEFRGQVSVRIPAGELANVLPRLRDDSVLAFDMLADLTCVHFPRRALPLGPYDVVYHLLSLSRGHRLRVKVSCPDPERGVASATPTWPGASYLEREAYDMFGVRFVGHPDLRRILMGDDFDGWPLRKDFPYRGH